MLLKTNNGEKKKMKNENKTWLELSPISHLITNSLFYSHFFLARSPGSFPVLRFSKVPHKHAK